MISNYVISFSLNGKTNVSPRYVMNLVMNKLEPVERHTKFGPPYKDVLV